MAGVGVGAGSTCCAPPPPCTTTICGVVYGCNSLPVQGASVSLTWTGGGASLTTDSSGQYCFTNPVLNPGDPSVTVTRTVTLTGFVTVNDSFSVSCYTASIANLTLTLATGFVCCAGCATSHPKTLTATTKYGTVTLNYVQPTDASAPYYYGSTTFTESNCASWARCTNADGNLPHCTWITTPQSSTCTVRFYLFCGHTDAYGAKHWFLSVQRNYVWSLNQPGPVDPSPGTVVNFSNGKCMPFADTTSTVCYMWPGSTLDSPAPPGSQAGFNASSDSYASTGSSECYPISLTFTVGNGTCNNLTQQVGFYPPWGTSNPSGFTATGVGPCSSNLTEFADTVSVM